MATEQKPKLTMQSLERFLDILETVAPAERGVGAADVAKAVGLPIATVSRLMHVLNDYELLHRPAGGREYVLGPRLFTLVSTATTQLDLVTVARPQLEALRDQTEETCSLHLRRGAYRVCVLEVPSRHQVRRVVPVGMTEPLGGSATGSVLLAGMVPAERKEVLAGMSLSTGQRRALMEMIEHASEHGWAINVDQWVPGLCGISAAIREQGETIATLSASGPSSRFTRERALSHVERLVGAAQRVSLQLSRHLEAS
jgi:IclR family transcriptional regulator, acetate operon repressor